MKLKIILPSLFILLLLLTSLLVGIFFSDEIYRAYPDRLLLAPSLSHLLGTDLLGRDLLLRVLHGAQISLLIGIGSSLGAVVIGVTYGLMASVVPRYLQLILLRVVDLLSSLPNLIWICLLLLVLQNVLIPTSVLSKIFCMVLALSLGSWMWFARMSYLLSTSIQQESYIEAAKAIGAGPVRILAKHVLPNMILPVVVFLGLQVPGMILFESFLSFLGIGLQSPATSWGLLIQEGWKSLSLHPHMIIGPSFILFLTMLCLDWIFEEFRVIFEPRLKAQLKWIKK